MSEIPKMDFYEMKITDVSALLSKYIKDAGGYGSENGNRFSHILHEVNGAFGSVYSLINLLRAEVEALKTDARRNVKNIDYHRLMLRIKDSGLSQEEAEKLADKIISMGWRPADTDIKNIYREMKEDYLP